MNQQKIPEQNSLTPSYSYGSSNLPPLNATKKELAQKNYIGGTGKTQQQFLKETEQKQNSTGKLEIIGYTLQEISIHNKDTDAWMALNGKIYDITNYIKYHPGGIKAIMEGAGKDGTFLFQKYHPWVNASFLLQKYQVGFVVAFKK